jgi:hypothetical protein
MNDQTGKPIECTPAVCAHWFLDPLSWMRPKLEQGKLDGRLECPKCHTNVGKYAWQGMQCSCNEWVVPAISLTKSRLDQVGSKDGSGMKSSETVIRHPPPSETVVDDSQFRTRVGASSYEQSNDSLTDSVSTSAGIPKRIEHL